MIREAFRILRTRTCLDFIEMPFGTVLNGLHFVDGHIGYVFLLDILIHTLLIHSNTDYL